MKRLDAANDNDAGKQIARTRQVWQPRLGRDLTDEDARQIIAQRHRLLRRARRMVAGRKARRRQ